MNALAKKIATLVLALISSSEANQISVMTCKVNTEKHLQQAKQKQPLPNIKSLTKTLPKASIVGLQDITSSQIQALMKAHPDYCPIGYNPTKKQQKRSFCPILFNSTQWTSSDSGTFNLTSSKMKSQGEDTDLTCNWVRLQSEQGAGIYIFNTQLDHSSQPAREQATHLLLEKINQRKYIDEPVILLGHFGVPSNHPVIHMVLNTKDLRGNSLINTPHATDPPKGLHTRAKGKNQTDYIFHSKALELSQTKVLNLTQKKGTAPLAQVSRFAWDQQAQRAEIDWRYFKETVLDKEFGDGKGTVIRWNRKSIPIRLIGATPKQTSLFENTIKQLNDSLKKTGINIVSTNNPSKAEIRCHVGTFDRLKRACHEESLRPPNDYAGFASLRWITRTKEIIESTILIATDRIDEKELGHVFLEELTQCLGLPGDNTVYPESITFSRENDHGNAPHLGTMDVQAIKLLYRHLKPGMNTEEAKKGFDQHWNSPSSAP